MRTWKPENTIPKEFRYLPSGFIYVIIACTRTIWPVGWENILLHGQYMTWCGIFPLYPPSSRSASRSISCFLARVHESFQIFFISPNYQPLYNKQSFCVILPQTIFLLMTSLFTADADSVASTRAPSGVFVASHYARRGDLTHCTLLHSVQTVHIDHSFTTWLSIQRVATRISNNEAS